MQLPSVLGGALAALQAALDEHRPQWLMHALNAADMRPGVRGATMHLPSLHEQAARLPEQPSLERATQTAGVCLALGTASLQRDDYPVTGGAEYQRHCAAERGVMPRALGRPTTVAGSW